MSDKRVRIDVTKEDLNALRRKVFSNLQLSGEERRRAAKAILVLPRDGSTVDIYFEGQFVGTL